MLKFAMFSIQVSALLCLAPVVQGAGVPHSDLPHSDLPPMSDPGAVTTPQPVSAQQATISIEVQSRRLGSVHSTTSLGSGVVVRIDRREARTWRLWIATSAHVVPCLGLCSIEVQLPTAEGKSRDGFVRRAARIVRLDRESDLALLEVKVPPIIELAVARRAVTGSESPSDRPVMAIGFPDPSLLGSGDKRGDRGGDRRGDRVQRVSRGFSITGPSALNADYRAFSSKAIQGRFQYRNALLHTARLVPGASGGPLVDASGAVIGINSGALLSKSQGTCLRADRTSAGRTSAGRTCLYLAVSMEPVWNWLDELSELK